MPDEQQTPVVTPGEPVKVTFSDEQKARINEIVKEASARAGSEARAEVERLKAEKPVAEQSSTDALLRLAEAQAELSSLKSAAQESKVRDVLHAAVSKVPFFDGELASQILRSSIKVVDGKPTVVDANGTARLNASFEPMSVAEAAEELARTKAFMVRSTMQFGAGSVLATSRGEVGPKLEDLFGANSNGAAANRLSLTDMPRYKRMRAEAQRQGLI